jgi:nitrite reductase/ring-hydroxylating ferredoxin subunit
MLERVDRLTSAAVVGQFYLVPTVFAEWDYRLDHWPVIGPFHADKQFFDFEYGHYHIDGRFLNARQQRHAERRFYTFTAQIQRTPLMTKEGTLNDPMPKTELRRRKCHVSHLDYEHHHEVPVKKLLNHFAGQQCAHGKAGWICPHQKASLGSVAAIDGVITCPLHGLRIDATSGVVLAPHNCQPTPSNE